MHKWVYVVLGVLAISFLALVFTPLGNTFASVTTFECSSYSLLTHSSMECICLGIRLDTTCLACSSASTQGCLGIVREQHCYETPNRELGGPTQEVPCS